MTCTAGHPGKPLSYIIRVGRASVPERGFNMAENNSEFSEKDTALYEALKERYIKSREMYKAMEVTGISDTQRANIEGQKKVFKRLLAEHRDDGNLAPLILCGAAGNVMAMNLLAEIMKGRAVEAAAGLTAQCTLPLLLAYQADLDREEIEKEISELEKN